MSAINLTHTGPKPVPEAYTGKMFLFIDSTPSPTSQTPSFLEQNGFDFDDYNNIVVDL
jgi:hypothetical protein